MQTRRVKSNFSLKSSTRLSQWQKPQVRQRTTASCSERKFTSKVVVLTTSGIIFTFISLTFSSRNIKVNNKTTTKMMSQPRFTRRNAMYRKPDRRRNEQDTIHRTAATHEELRRTVKRRSLTQVCHSSVSEAAEYINSLPDTSRYERKTNTQDLAGKMDGEFLTLSDLAGILAQELASAIQRGAFSPNVRKQQGSTDDIFKVSMPARRRSVVSSIA
jgi:hypothetical protein